MPLYNTDQIIWVVPSLSGGWVANSAAEYAPGYSLDDRVIRLRGCMRSGTIGNTAFTLPVGYRPERRMLFVQRTGSTSGVGWCEVTASGQVIPASGANNYFFLDGINFCV
jgi:hypothetical protein